MNTVSVGDKIRFSLELLEQIRDEGGRTQVLTVVAITDDEPGFKTILVRTTEQ